MITFRKMLDYIVAEPFRPFRIKLACGQTFEIRYPESIYVGVKSVEMFLAAGEEQHEKWHRVPLSQVQTLEPLDSATAMAG